MAAHSKRIEWLKGSTVPIACPACGAHALDDLTPPSATPASSDSALKFYVEQGAGIDVMLGPLFRVPRERVKRYLEVGCGVESLPRLSRAPIGRAHPARVSRWPA